MDKAARLNLSAGLASVGTALFLVGLKLWALVATGALSVGASLADSLIDLMASSAGLAGILYAAKPPDEDHSFGHSSAEDLVGLGQALFVAVSAGLIGWTAVRRLAAPQPLASEGLGVATMAAAMAVTLALVLWQGRVARTTGSRIVAADRLHYVADLLPAAGAIAALYAAGRWGVLWLDPVVALVACVVLLMGARRIGIGAWNALMDRAADREVIETVERIVAAYPGRHRLPRPQDPHRRQPRLHPDRPRARRRPVAPRRPRHRRRRPPRPARRRSERRRDHPPRPGLTGRPRVGARAVSDAQPEAR